MSLFDMAATSAVARAFGVADVSHTRLDFNGPLSQLGYVTPPRAWPTSVAMRRHAVDRRAIASVSACGVLARHHTRSTRPVLVSTRPQLMEILEYGIHLPHVCSARDISRGNP